MRITSRPPTATSAFGVLLALGLGFVVMLGVLGCLLWLSNDMRLLLIVGAVGLFAVSFGLSRWRGARILAVVIPPLPLAAVFAYLVLPQLPGLWPHLVLWAAASFLGGAVAHPGRRRHLVWAGGLALVLASAGYAVSYLPGEITRSLTQLKNEPAPPFEVFDLDGKAYPEEKLSGVVLVLDFFATWCAPCIAELPELEAMRQHFGDRDDVRILVVANDSGGDTPKAIKRFKTERGLALEFAYDPQGAAHAAFGFLGLPGLVVIDRQGSVRLAREGFNEAESGLAEDLIETIEALP